MRVFAVVAVWGNTKDNHAGMFYLTKRLKQSIGKNFILIPTPTKGSRFLASLYRLYNILIALWLKLIVKKNDIVLLMEYLLSETEQSDIARILKNDCDVRGMAHLVPHRLEKEYSSKEMLKKIGYLNRIYVLGSSLKEYFVSKGVDKSKIIVTYHYVDNIFYHPEKNYSDRLTIICIGNMERDYDFIYNIIIRNPDINFIICKGKIDFPPQFNTLPNLTMYGFITEQEMLKLMQHSDISLNVMKDTIGSNVITTSMACGLAMVASNVGSIADYISHGKSGLLFNNDAECSEYINLLKDSPQKLRYFKESALKRSEGLSIDSFISWFKNEFYEK